MKFLKRDYKRVVIMLGAACNMKCDYCIQRFQKPPTLPNQINLDIFDFLDEVTKESPGVDIRFYGGEPTLYFDHIQKIAAHLGANHNYSILTNGKAVTEEMTTLFNTYGMFVSVSWDGEATKETRHEDVLAQNENLIKIENLMVEAVISSKCYPKEFLEALEPYDKRYFAMHGHHIWAGMDFIVDSGIPKQDLSYSLDSGRLYAELADLLDGYHEAEENPEKAWPIRDNLMRGYRRAILEEKEAAPWTPCGSGFSMLNLDLQGNLYACHNTFHRIGDIYDDYFSVLSEAIMADPTIEDEETCKNCPAKKWCSGGCRLARSSKKALESQCKLNKAVDWAFRDAAKKYGWKTTKGE